MRTTQSRSFYVFEFAFRDADDDWSRVGVPSGRLLRFPGHLGEDDTRCIARQIRDDGTVPSLVLRSELRADVVGEVRVWGRISKPKPLGLSSVDDSPLFSTLCSRLTSVLAGGVRS